MITLENVDNRFEIEFSVIQNGSGRFKGVIDEISQTQAPSYVFSQPRRILRVKPGLLISSTMVIRSAGGTNYLIGNHGDSENAEGTIFRSFRLFETHTLYSLQRRLKVTEPITGLREDTELDEIAQIWGTYEPLPEMFDRETRVAAETARFITNYPIQRQDVIDNKSVFRVDQQLGLYIATLA